MRASAGAVGAVGGVENRHISETCPLHPRLHNKLSGGPSAEPQPRVVMGRDAWSQGGGGGHLAPLPGPSFPLLIGVYSCARPNPGLFVGGTATQSSQLPLRGPLVNLPQ